MMDSCPTQTLVTSSQMPRLGKWRKRCGTPPCMCGRSPRVAHKAVTTGSWRRSGKPGWSRAPRGGGGHLSKQMLLCLFSILCLFLFCTWLSSPKEDIVCCLGPHRNSVPLVPALGKCHPTEAVQPSFFLKFGGKISVEHLHALFCLDSKNKVPIPFSPISIFPTVNC